MIILHFLLKNEGKKFQFPELRPRLWSGAERDNSPELTLGAEPNFYKKKQIDKRWRRVHHSQPGTAIWGWRWGAIGVITPA